VEGQFSELRPEGVLGSTHGPDLTAPDQRMAYLILAAFPAGISGLMFEDFFATAARSPWVVVVNLTAPTIPYSSFPNMGHPTDSWSACYP